MQQRREVCHMGQGCCSSTLRNRTYPSKRVTIGWTGKTSEADRVDSSFSIARPGGLERSRCSTIGMEQGMEVQSARALISLHNHKKYELETWYSTERTAAVTAALPLVAWSKRRSPSDVYWNWVSVSRCLCGSVPRWLCDSSIGEHSSLPAPSPLLPVVGKSKWMQRGVLRSAAKWRAKRRATATARSVVVVCGCRVWRALGTDARPFGQRCLGSHRSRCRESARGSIGTLDGPQDMQDIGRDLVTSELPWSGSKRWCLGSSSSRAVLRPVVGAPQRGVGSPSRP